MWLGAELHRVRRIPTLGQFRTPFKAYATLECAYAEQIH
jgi:hypothetical protein